MTLGNILSVFVTDNGPIAASLLVRVFATLKIPMALPSVLGGAIDGCVVVLGRVFA